MDKFVNSFSRGHKKQKISQKSLQKHINGQPGGQQMYLDLGQKLFGMNKECASCEKVQEKLADMVLIMIATLNNLKACDGPILSSMKGHLILSDNLAFRDGKKAVVLEVRSKLKLLPENVARILTIVGNELGSSSDYISEGKKSIYLYVLEGSKTVIGCLVAEEILSEALVALSSTVTASDVSIKIPESNKKERFRDEGSQFSQSSNSQKENDPYHLNFACKIKQNGHSSRTGKRSNECLFDREKPSVVTLGVKQIWVHSKYRRNNIARTLLDIGRQHFMFGNIVLRSQVAFSQPTADGLKFALSYSQSDTIWGYS